MIRSKNIQVRSFSLCRNCLSMISISFHLIDPSLVNQRISNRRSALVNPLIIMDLLFFQFRLVIIMKPGRCWRMHLLGHGELPIPNGLDPCLVKEKINSELMDLGCRGDVSMHAYGNKDTFSDDTKRWLYILTENVDPSKRASWKFCLIENRSL